METRSERMERTPAVEASRALSEQKMVALSNFLFEVGGWAIAGAAVGGAVGTVGGPMGTLSGVLGGAILGAGAALFHRATKYRDP